MGWGELHSAEPPRVPDPAALAFHEATCMEWTPTSGRWVAGIPDSLYPDYLGDLKMQIIGPNHRPNNQCLGGKGPGVCILNPLPRGFGTLHGLRTYSNR